MRSIKSRGKLTHGRGMTKAVRDLWIASLSSSANIHNGMMKLTGTEPRSDRHHVEIGVSRKKNEILMTAGKFTTG